MSLSLLLILVIIPIVTLLRLYYITQVVLIRLPINYPSSENRKNADPNKKTMVCFGDSNTHGNVSFDWVDSLRTESADRINIFNAGINADLSFTLLRRIEEVVACNPDFITILIGTNDANALIRSSNEKRYRKLNKLLKEEYPSSQAFVDNYRQIIETLNRETKAKIALVTLPLISEDLDFKGNQITSKYSDMIISLSKEYKLDLLDLRSKQLNLLPTPRKKITWPYQNFRFMMYVAVFLKYSFRVSWNFPSRLFQNYSTTDNIHLNETCGKEMAALVSNWFSKK